MAYELIETITVETDSPSSVEFTSIPQDGTHLKLIVSARTSFISADDSYGKFSINSDTSTDYALQRLRMISSNTIQAQFLLDAGARNLEYSASGATANTFSNGEITFFDYTSSSRKRLFTHHTTENYEANDVGIQKFVFGQYFGTSAITSLQLTTSDSFQEHSTFSLYKIT